MSKKDAWDTEIQTKHDIISLTAMYLRTQKANTLDFVVLKPAW